MSVIYEFHTRTLQGKETDLSAYRGKVLLIVNTASKCGLTPQYDELQKLYETHREQGLEILGFPCNQFGEQEPGSASEIQEFCKLNYGVTFPLFEKTDVRGPEAHPLFRYLTEQAPFQGDNPADPGDSIKWNFTKFLIDREGRVVQRFEPKVPPLDIATAIQELL